MKLRALVRGRESIERFLRHQGLWTDPPGLTEAGPPPQGQVYPLSTQSGVAVDASYGAFLEVGHTFAA